MMDSMRPAKLKSAVFGLATALCVVAATHVATAAEDKAKSIPKINAPTPAFSDARLKAFATASMNIVKIRRKYWPQVQATDNEDEMRKIAEIAKKEMMKAIKAHGLTVEQYNAVVTAAQKDPSLVERIEKIEKRTKTDK